MATQLARAAAAVTLLLLAGCLPEVRHKAPMPTPPAVAPEKPGAELVYVDSALIEQPLGDAFLCEGLWEAGDEEFIGVEQLPALGDNGLRVCRLGGSLPPRLQALLSSKRSCPQPRRQRTPPGEAVTVPTGPRRAECAFTLHSGGPTRVVLADVECVFEVVPSVGEEGELTLRFVPQARHGEARRRAGVERSADGPLRLALEQRPPTEEYSALGVDVPISPGEFIAIGARVSRPGTLGQAWFTGDGETGPVQRLLVVRATRVSPPRGEEGPARAGPLALQAGRATIRGSRP